MNIPLYVVNVFFENGFLNYAHPENDGANGLLKNEDKTNPGCASLDKI